MTGYIDVGGGMRGVFGAGVLDYFMDNGLDADYYIGVSAGSANISSYLAGQRGRTYRFYTVYAKRPEYMSLQNFVRKRSYFDLDYVYSELSSPDGEDPLDYEKFLATDKPFYTVATRASDGKAQYFTLDDYSPYNCEVLKASCTIPGVCSPRKIGDETYFDGGVADPIPVQKALDDGCDKVILVLTRPIDYVKRPEYFKPIYSKILKDYPMIVEGLNNRHKAYNDGVQKAIELQKEGKVEIIAPSMGYYLTAFTKSEGVLKDLYDDGYRSAKEFAEKTEI